MNKKFLVSMVLVLVLILAGCKNSGTDPAQELEEKKSCYKECMLLENDKAYCMEDCEVEEKDVEEKPVCGDAVCQPVEQESGLCPGDCGCLQESDCSAKEICESGSCKAVDCKLNSDCPTNMQCSSNSCVKIDVLDTAALENMKNDINALQDDIQAMLDDIDGLQDALDAADASDDDKDPIQDEIDALSTPTRQLTTYDTTLDGYLEDLDAVETNTGLAAVGTAFNSTKEKVDAYIETWQSTIDDIQDEIDALEPSAKPDLVVHDFDVDDVDGLDGTFTVTIKNEGDGNVSSTQTFRVQLTSYDLDNDTNDDSKVTVSSGIDPDDEKDLEMSVEMVDLEDYFTDHPNATSVVLKFLVQVDLDNTINETNETNNNKTFNVSFNRGDFVSNSAPVANINVSTTTATVNSTVITFIGTGSTDSDGTISSYNWNFGDSQYATSSTATHTYAAAGTYSVVLTVTDNNGATDTESVTITVT